MNKILHLIVQNFLVFYFSNGCKSQSMDESKSFEKYLDIFSDCLIHLINYQGIDVFSLTSTLKIPIIRSRYKTFRKTNCETSIREREPPLFIKYEITNVSKYYNPTSQIDSIQNDVATKNKNWFCIASLFLYSPIISKPDLIYPNFTKTYIFSIPTSYINYGLPKSTFNPNLATQSQMKPFQSYNILITTPPEHLHVTLQSYTTPWVKLFSNLMNQNPDGPYIKFQLYSDLLVAETTKFELSVVSTWYVCKYCNWCKLYSLIKLPTNIFTRHDLNSRINASRQAKSLWIVNHPWSAYSWYGKHSRSFQELQGHHMTFKKQEMYPEDSEFAVTYLNQALSHIIFGNHSFTSVKLLESFTEPCPCPYYLLKQRLLLPVLIYTEGSQTDFLVVEETHPFKFVSCGGGPRYKSILSFSSFYNVFDRWTWYSIFLLYFLIIQVISGLKSRSDVLLTSFAILVEQGQTKCIRLRNKNSVMGHIFAYGSLVIAAVLLSNAYKGDNITTLTLPSLPLPYETLDDLLKNNLTLYQRAERHANLEWSMSITSPSMISSRTKNLLLSNLITINSSLTFDKLKVCSEISGAALFQGEVNCFEDGELLRNYSHIDWNDVSVSTESYSGVWRGIKILNNVDRQIDKNVEILYETGIITQWVNMWLLRMFLQKTSYRLHWIQSEHKRKYFEKEIMDVKEWNTSLVLNGSIVTLFICLSFGVGIAGVCFVFLRFITLKFVL